MISFWPNRDPLMEKGGLNLYGFISNDPINLFDTDGQTSASSTSSATATPKFLTRSVRYHSYTNSCCWSILGINWTLTVTDAANKPVAGLSLSESISMSGRHYIGGPQTHGATTDSMGRVTDIYAVNFITCFGAAFVNIQQTVSGGGKSTIDYTDHWRPITA